MAIGMKGCMDPLRSKEKNYRFVQLGETTLSGAAILAMDALK
jgi:hypothetical protein